MARLEASITLGQRPSPQTSFSPVKAPVQHGPPAGAISQTPFLLSAVPSGQASPASSPDRTKTSSSLDMTSPLENLYPENDSTELVFAQPGPVSTAEHVSDPLPVSAQDVLPPEQFEQGEVSELEDQPELDTADSDRQLVRIKTIVRQ